MSDGRRMDAWDPMLGIGRETKNGYVGGRRLQATLSQIAKVSARDWGGGAVALGPYPPTSSVRACLTDTVTGSPVVVAVPLTG